MFMRKKNNDNINIEKVNDVVSLSSIILKILCVLLVILGIYAITLLFKEWKIVDFLLTILKIVSPLFIGLLVAWLFDPFVTWLNKKGIGRGLGTTITYVLMISIIYLIISAIIPLLSDQINDFANSIPSIFETIKTWITDALDKFKGIENFDINSMRNQIFNTIENIGDNLTTNLPSMTVSIVSSIISGIGTIVIGLIIGFYLLINFDDTSDIIMAFVPKTAKADAQKLISEVNAAMRRFVQGTLLLSLVIFVTSSLAFALIGLKAPLLFGLFCGITNIIPYAGPYIGGAPAVIVGLSQSTPTGLLVLLALFVIQFLEGNIFQPMVMSKTMKLNPVTIIIGLLVFGHFFGIIGMIISTPIIAAIKGVFNFLNEKYRFIVFTAP